MPVLSDDKTILILSPIDCINRQDDATRQDIFTRAKIFLSLNCKVVVVEWSQESGLLQQDVYEDKILVYRLPRRCGKNWWQPYRQRGLDTRAARIALLGIIEQVHPTHVWCEYDYFAPLVHFLKKRFPKLPIAVRSHNYELGHSYHKWQLQTKKTIYGYFCFLFFQWRILHIGRLLARYVDVVYCISRIDQRLYKKRFPTMHTVYMPLYVEFGPWCMPPPQGILHLVYLSSTLSNEINKSGVDMLFNIAKACIHDPVVFHVTGNYTNSGQPVPSNVIFHGFIDVLSKFLNTMDGAIVPVQYGYGMKGKVYETLYRGMPTVVTSRVHGVMGGLIGQTYLVADTDDEWRRAVQILLDSSCREVLGRSARFFMLKYFSKEYVTDQLKNFLFLSL